MGTDDDRNETAQRAAAAMWAGDRASQAMGMELVEVGAGRAVLTMIVRDDMVNGHDMCHGGHVFTLADSAFAFACNSRGLVTVAQGADITFLAPARRGETLRATATERWQQGRNGITDVTVIRIGTDGSSEEVIAEFRGRSRTIGDSFV